MHLGHLKLVKYLDENGALLVINKFKGQFLCSNRQKEEISGKKVIEASSLFYTRYQIHLKT